MQPLKKKQITTKKAEKSEPLTPRKKSPKPLKKKEKNKEKNSNEDEEEKTEKSKFDF